MKNQEVQLSVYEMMLASHIGSIRRIWSINARFNKNKHAKKSDWQTDIDGAGAEIAVAKALGVYWEPGVNTFKLPDVGSLQVRSTSYQNGNLIIRPNDADNETYVLVITDPPLYRLVGVITGRDAKQDRFYMPGDNGESRSWWVPQEYLGDLPWIKNEDVV